MNSFTSDADRNRVPVRCATTKVPAWRSNTAMPASTPGGTGTDDGEGDVDGEGDKGADGDRDGDGDEDGADHTVAGAGAWHPASVAPSSATASTRPNLIHRSLNSRR